MATKQQYNIIVWREALSVGDPTIDNQHKNLIQIINDLANSRGAEPETMRLLQEHSLAMLKQYTIEHFSDEEVVMLKIGYPSVKEHRAEHMELIRKYKEVEKNIDTTLFMMDLMRFLSEWLEKHILVDDMAYKPYLLEYARKIKI
jgi:hemerythrin